MLFLFLFFLLNVCLSLAQEKVLQKKSLTSLTTSEILSCNKLKCNVLAVFCTVIDRRKIEVYPSPIPQLIPHHSCPCIGIASSAFVNSVSSTNTKWFWPFMISIYLLPDFQGRKLLVSLLESTYFL